MKRALLAVASTLATLVILLSYKNGAGKGHIPGPVSTASLAPVDSHRPGPRIVDGPLVRRGHDTVQVRLVVAGNRIEAVSVPELGADNPYSEAINRAAEPALIARTIHAQGSDIDMVSGATYTSEAYLDSLQGAMDRAGMR
jgi:hypothetical protein